MVWPARFIITHWHAAWIPLEDALDTRILSSTRCSRLSYLIPLDGEWFVDFAHRAGLLHALILACYLLLTGESGRFDRTESGNALPIKNCNFCRYVTNGVRSIVDNKRLANTDGQFCVHFRGGLCQTAPSIILGPRRATSCWRSTVDELVNLRAVHLLPPILRTNL